MKKLDIIRVVISFVLAVAGLVLIVINIINNGSWTLTVGLLCVVVSQLFLLPDSIRKRNSKK
ncbi:MAG: hypothetical protein KBT09_10250 [Bacteroidales bacterium]|nr:hypothetical protein [Candidatus Sodaliphilus fimicaballi]